MNGAKLCAEWVITACDDCGQSNATGEEFPDGWCVLARIEAGKLAHFAMCPGCLVAWHVQRRASVRP